MRAIPGVRQNQDSGQWEVPPKLAAWAEARARELAAEAFDNRANGVDAWLVEAQTGDLEGFAFDRASEVLRLAISYCAFPTVEGMRSLEDEVGRLRDCYVRQNCDKFADAAWDELEQE